MRRMVNRGRQCSYCHLTVPGRKGHGEPGGADTPVYCCFGCALAAEITRARGEKGKALWLLTRLGVSAFLTMGVMVFSLAMYSRDIYPMASSAASPAASSLAGLFRYTSLILATPVFLLLGLPILTNAVEQFRARIISTDALVLMGVAAAYLYSYVSTLTDHGATYYETACMILVLITLGRYLEATGKLKASAAVRALGSLVPDEVVVRKEGEDVTVKMEQVRAGDLVRVVAGQRVPVDGTIESGRAHVDEQVLTGESRPVVRERGEQVRAGTMSVDGALTIRASAVGSDHAIGRLMALLERAKRSKGRYETLADRVASWFVPTVIVLAGVGAWTGYERGGIDEAIMTALAVMLISCPCALGIATPMAIWVALGRAAGRGVLFRHGRAVEALAAVRAIALDKTGTLTSGEPEVVSFVTDPDDEATQREVLARAAGLAGGSDHALARSVTRYAKCRGVAPNGMDEVRTVAGRGLAGTSEGKTIRLGSATMMAEHFVSLSKALRGQVDRATASAWGVTCLAVENIVGGVFAFSEHLRPEAGEVLAALQSSGYDVCVLTGDHPQRGEEISRRLTVRTVAQLTPEGKIKHLERIRRDVGAVAMVGDGLNDAPALAFADVGVAMGCGADVTRASAAVCLLGSDLRHLAWAVRLARKTVRMIKVNLFWAFVYNLAGLTLALTGRLSPLFAAGAMVVSSLFVVTNSLRLGTSPVSRFESAEKPAPSFPAAQTTRTCESSV